MTIHDPQPDPRPRRVGPAMGATQHFAERYGAALTRTMTLAGGTCGREAIERLLEALQVSSPEPEAVREALRVCKRLLSDAPYELWPAPGTEPSDVEVQEFDAAVSWAGTRLSEHAARLAQEAAGGAA